MKKIFILSIITASLIQANILKAEEIKYGIATDFLPYIMYGITGKPGYSMQAWAGAERFRIRAVRAEMHLPDFFANTGDSFTDQKLTASAIIFDVFCNKTGLDGFWAGTGYEFWQNSILAKQTRKRYNWTNNVATLGAGYIWKFAGPFYIEPWCAGHFVMNQKIINSGSGTFTPKRINGEISMKAGVFF